MDWASVNIGIHGLRLIAEYQDVDHSTDGDNAFMMANPHDSDEKRRFQRVIRNYCRSVCCKIPGTTDVGALSELSYT